jgi:hypothetical protein
MKRSKILVGAPLSPTLPFLQTTQAVHLLFTVWWRVRWSLKLFGLFLGHVLGPFQAHFCFSEHFISVDATTLAVIMTKNGHDQQQTIPACLLYVQG